jgi:UPF0755 protein
MLSYFSKDHPLFKPLAGLISGLVIVIFGLGLYSYSLFFGAGPNTADNKPREVYFPAGSSVSAIGKALKKSGAIRSDLAFKIMAKLSGQERRFQSGTYLIPSGASLPVVVKMIAEGKVLQLTITLPEGRSAVQAVKILMANKDLSGELVMPEEGSLLPETYTYQRGEARQAVMDRMKDAGTKALDELWESRAPDLPIKNKYEALILASVIEKETGINDERERVAAVFVNRLRKGMRLESDPTVIYPITRGEPLGRGIRRSELDNETPWNTYKIFGLPKTPITNPGKAAIKATLNPAKTDEYFFVADGTGGHIFAKTYEEHLMNVAQWRQIERAEKSNNSQFSESSSSADSAQIMPHTRSTPF